MGSRLLRWCLQPLPFASLSGFAAAGLSWAFGVTEWWLSFLAAFGGSAGLSAMFWLAGRKAAGEVSDG